MHVIDVPDIDRIRHTPDGTITILDRPCRMHGWMISMIELRLYMNGPDQPCIITAYIMMGGHTIETTYQDGCSGETPLQDAAEFLMYNLGPSGVVLRAKIALEAEMPESGKI